MEEYPEMYLEVNSVLNKRIRITKDYWNRIVETKHKIMKGKKKIVEETLKNPDEIRISRKDQNVFLYYKRLNGKYNCVVAKHLNGTGFIITAYITDKIKIGEKYETNQNFL